mgnify:CR=1 FL=1
MKKRGAGFQLPTFFLLSPTFLDNLLLILLFSPNSYFFLLSPTFLCKLSEAIIFMSSE